MRSHRRGRPPYPGTLTPAEQHVLKYLRDGMTNVEIAYRLGISPDGVKYHVSNMLGKLKLDNRRELAKWQPGREEHTGLLQHLRGWLPFVALSKILGVALAGAAVLALGASATSMLKPSAPSVATGTATATRTTSSKLTVDTGYGWRYVIDSINAASTTVKVAYHVEGATEGLSPLPPIYASKVDPGVLVASFPRHNGQTIVEATRMPGSSSVTIQFDGAARAVSSPATVDFERDSTGWAPNQIMVGEEPWDANVAVIKDHGEPFTSVRVESTLMLNDPGVQVGQATLVDNLGNSYPLYHGSANYPPTGSIWDFEGPVNPVASTLTFTVQGYAALEDGDWTINVPVG